MARASASAKRSPLRLALRRSRRRTVAFLAVYFCIAIAGLATLRASNKYEWFPFTAWPLFCITPADGDEYGLRIIEDDAARYYEVSQLRQTHRAHSLDHANDVYAITQGLGRAIRRSDEATRERLVRQLRRHQLRAASSPRRQPLRIEVVRRVFDPVDRYRTGVIETEEVVAEFTLPPEDADASDGSPGGPG